MIIIPILSIKNKFNSRKISTWSQLELHICNYLQLQGYLLMMQLTEIIDENKNKKHLALSLHRIINHETK